MEISETIAASGLKICRCRQLIQYMKVSIEGKGHFLTLFLSRFCMFCGFTRPIYQVSVYRTIGPLVTNYQGLPALKSARHQEKTSFLHM